MDAEPGGKCPNTQIFSDVRLADLFELFHS